MTHTPPDPADRERLAQLRKFINEVDHGVSQPDIAFLIRLLDAQAAPPPASAMEERLKQLGADVENALTIAGNATKSANKFIEQARAEARDEALAEVDAFLLKREYGALANDLRRALKSTASGESE